MRCQSKSARFFSSEKKTVYWQGNVPFVTDHGVDLWCFQWYLYVSLVPAISFYAMLWTLLVKVGLHPGHLILTGFKICERVC